MKLLSLLFTAALAQVHTEGPPPSSNTFLPVSAAAYNYFYSVGANCLASPYQTPGISPAPSAGVQFYCADLIDSTPGNFSTTYALAYNQGSRYTAAATAVGVIKAGTVAGNVWGGQFSAIAWGNASGILQGANIESDWASGAVVGIGATIKLGSSDGSANYNPGNSYLNFLADAGRAPRVGMRFQANSLDSSASLISIEYPFTGCIVNVNGTCVSMGGGVGPQGPPGPAGPQGPPGPPGSGGGVGKQMLVANTNTAVSGGQTIYFSTGGYSGGIVQAEIIAPFAFTARNLWGKGHGAPGNGQNYVYHLMKNGQQTSLGCTVVGANTDNCNDNSNSVTFAAGDRYQVRLITTGGAAPVVHSASFQIDF
jgi:hypothetical protein